MKEAENQTESENSGRAISEFGTVTIDFNPGPDAEDRLRRLFTLLLNHVASEWEYALGQDAPAGSSVRDADAVEPSASDAHS